MHKNILRKITLLALQSLIFIQITLNPLNAELNPIGHLLALVGAHHILHVSRVRVKFRNVTQREYRPSPL